LFNAEPTWDTTGTLCTDPERTTDGKKQQDCRSVSFAPSLGSEALSLTPSVTYLAKGDHSLALGASAASKSLVKALRAAS